MRRLSVAAGVVMCFALAGCGFDTPEKSCVDKVRTGSVLMGKFGGYQPVFECRRWEYRCPAPSVVAEAEGWMICRLPRKP